MDLFTNEQLMLEKKADQSNGETVAAIYARTSSSSQRFGYSIDEQVRRCWERCELLDWDVRFVFTDEAESGRDTDRDQFQELLQKAEQGLIDVVVFWKLDRFCRSLVDLVKTEERLEEWGVALQSVTEHIDTMSAVGRFNFRNLASAAELESDLTSQRSKMGMYGLAKEHRWPNETPPLGYRREDDGTLEIIDNEAKLVNQIFQLYLSEKSMPRVAHQLNKSGQRTKADEEWTRQAVKTVLSNELYVGQYKVAGYEEYVEEYRILPDDLFEEATEARFRFQHTKPRMEEDRKLAKADDILAEYKQMVGDG